MLYCSHCKTYPGITTLVGNRYYCIVCDYELTDTAESVQSAKQDTGKPDYAKLPLDLLDGTAIAFSKGAVKHGHNNYRKGVDDLDLLISPLLRHLSQLQLAIANEDIDGSKGFLIDEIGTAHIHNVIANAIMIVHAMRLKGFSV